MSKNYAQMVCLVGENPLPVYLGIRQLAAPDATIILVHTGDPGTFPIARKLQGKVDRDNRENGVRRTVKPVLLSDPHCPQVVRERFAQLKQDYPNAALNYTGGTKVMAAYAVMEWRDCLSSTFYLEEADKLFHLGNAIETLPLAVPLTLRDLCELHDVKEDRQESFEDCTREDLLQIWNALRPNWLSDLYKASSDWNRRDHSDQFKWLADQYDRNSKQWRLGSVWRKFIEHLTPETQAKWLAVPFPASLKEYYRDEPRSESVLYRQLRCATGVWMEQLMQALVQEACPKTPSTMFLFGQHFKVDGQEFESDIVAVNNHCLRYLSVTSSLSRGSEKAYKGRMFEAIHRAQQLGGGLAQSCLVCPAEYDVVGKVQSSIGHRSRHKVFGRNDVEEWIGGNYATLQEFLQG
jgi:hypothetical protein